MLVRPNVSDRLENRVVRVFEAINKRGVWWATCLLMLLLPLSVYWSIGPSVAPWVLDIYVRPGLDLSDLAVGALFLTSAIGLGRRSEAWGHPFLVPLLALVGLAVLTLPTALMPTLAGYTAVRWLVAVGVYIGLVRSRVPMERLVTIFLVGLSVHALIGLGQVLKRGPLGLPGELALESFQRNASIIRVAGTAGIPAFGLTFNPNVLGGFLSVGLLLSLPLLAHRGLRIAWWLAWLGLLLSFSRSAWLATALLMPLAAGWLAGKRTSIRRSLKITFIGAVLITLVVSIFWHEQMSISLYPITAPVGSAIDRVLSSMGDSLQSMLSPSQSQLPMSSVDHLQEETSATEGVQSATRGGERISSKISLAHRIELWKVAIGIVASRPLTGVGAGNYPVIAPSIVADLHSDHAHNVPLQLAAEIGVIGGGIWLWIWLASALMLVQRWQVLNSWAVVSICAWLALGLISLYDGYPWMLNAGRLLTVTVLSLVSRTTERG